MADTPTVTSTPSLSDASTFDLVKSVLGSSTTKGAALGALMSNILGSISEPGGVVQPLDMSKYGIQPRTTTITPPRYIPYSRYATRDPSSAMSPEMARQFGAVSGLGSLVSPASLSAVPAFYAAERPLEISSVGAGRQLAPTLSLTPRSNQQISPLTGALLGAAAGYLLPSGSSAAGGAGGASGSSGLAPSGAFGELINRAVGGVKNFFKAPERAVSGTGAGPIEVGTYLDNQGRNVTVYSDGSEFVGGSSLDLTDNQNYYSGSSGYTPSYGSYGGDYGDYGYSDVVSSGDLGSQGSFSFKDGGMATPLMAEGGMTPEPSFYTYGTAIDPQQVMQQLAQGGYATGGMAQGGLHVPVVEGRHDYRSGSRVSGEGDGQSDDIPAMLADGEYVFDADTVAQLGNGSTKAGSDLLDKFREEIRSHKRSAPVDKIPPPSKSPLQYLKQAQARSKKNG